MITRLLNKIKIPGLFILRFVNICCLTVLCNIPSFAQELNKKILIINSFDNNITYASQIIDTTVNRLNKYYNNKVTFYHINMDVNSDANYNINLSEYNPDAVLAFGKEATILYNNYGKNSILSEPKAPMVTVNALDYFPRQTAGVKYDIPAKANVELIVRTIPNLKEIVFIDNIYDESTKASELINQEIKKQNLKVKYKYLPLNKTNGDEIIKVLLEEVSGRVIVTYAWNFNINYSSNTHQELDSLLSTKLTSPIFSLTNNNEENNYIVGGYCYSTRIGGEKAADEIIALLEGKKPNEIPKEYVKNINLVLNKTAVNRFNIKDIEKDYFDIKYVNIPPTFFEKNKFLLIFIIVAGFLLTILIAAILSNIKKNSADKRLTNEYKKRYSVLERIYEHSNIDFAVYDNYGIKKFEIINKRNNIDNKQIRKFIPDNLFNAKFLNNEKDNIRNKKTINLEYESKDKSTIYKIVIKPLTAGIASDFRYSLSLTTAQADAASLFEETEKAYKLITNAADALNIGIAYYNIFTGEGYATDNWFNNFGEEKNPDESINPSYSNISAADKAGIINFKKNISKGDNAIFEKDIQVSYKDASDITKIKWIRNNIIIKEYMPDKNKITVIDINFDITNEKQKGEKLILLNKKVDDAYKDSSAFINGISHEVRTPLTSIVGFSKMLINNDESADSDEIVNIIKRNNVLLIELINNILALANIDSGNYVVNKSMIPLNDIFRDIGIATAHMLTTEKLLTKKNIEIITDIPSEDYEIYTDEWSFRQVMLNLLSNAVKFTESGTIVFGYQVQKNGFYFYVKDTGCGISPEDMDKIFKRFEKLNISSGGNGLGLSLCKSIISLLEGEIGVISKESEGSTFWFTLN